MDNRDFDFETDVDASLATEFYSIPVARLVEMVAEYVSKLETERTNEWCKCEWIIHPDDQNIDPHNCVTCGHPSLLHMSGPDSYCTMQMNQMTDGENFSFCECKEWVSPPKRRMRRGTQHPNCPVHTKEGLITGFFEWVFNDGPKR